MSITEYKVAQEGRNLELIATDNDKLALVRGNINVAVGECARYGGMITDKKNNLAMFSKSVGKVIEKTKNNYDR